MSSRERRQYDIPAPTTPREAAKHLIAPYVARQLPVILLEGGIVGHWDHDYCAATGCIGRTFSTREQLGASEIGVACVNGESCHEVFSLREIYAEVEQEIFPDKRRQAVLFEFQPAGEENIDI